MQDLITRGHGAQVPSWRIYGQRRCVGGGGWEGVFLKLHEDIMSNKYALNRLDSDGDLPYIDVHIQNAQPPPHLDCMLFNLVFSIWPGLVGAAPSGHNTKELLSVHNSIPHLNQIKKITMGSSS